MAKKKKTQPAGLTQFDVKNLHGRPGTISLRFRDNKLILVGENGAGKTTMLNLLFYTLSSQWVALGRYSFRELVIHIDGKKHTVKASDLGSPPIDLDRYARRIPMHYRKRLSILIAQFHSHGVFDSELEHLCKRFDLPFRQILESAPEVNKEGLNRLKDTHNSISELLSAQILYLPTYRRIEQELELIFSGLDQREIRAHRERMAGRQDESYVELVEFGMNDVKEGIAATRRSLSEFARENLNTLTFGYLGDIVDAEYSEVDLQEIREASDVTIASVLNRIQEHILSSERKTKLKSMIERAKREDNPDEQTKIICHYFSKLMRFQSELEQRESHINSFCSICSEYMPTKTFTYDSSDFTFRIGLTHDEQPPESDDNEIKLQQLSSGEKQIVSLFSHLYLSGGKRYFVLIDEPELSLSVPWQRRFLADIAASDFCSGLVAVTHSPFIYDNELRDYARGFGEFEGPAAQ